MESLTKLLRLDPANRQLRQDCIHAAFQARDYQSVIKLADEGLVGAPDDIDMNLAKANGLIGSKDFSGAIDVLQRIQTLDPLNVVTGQNLGLCFYATGNYGAARDQLEAVYAAEVRTSDVVRLLVSSCHHLGHMDRALEIADANRELARSDSALAGVYSLLYSDANRIVDSKKFATYALRDNPNNLDALTSDATLRLAAGDMDGARGEFEQILTINPKVGRAHLGLGSLALLRQDFVQAKSDLTRAIEWMPGHVGTRHALGWAHLVAGELDDAERVFSDALDMDRNFAETHGALASVAALRGNQGKAEESIRIALRLDPTSLAARFAQSVLASRAGNPEESQRIILEALKQMMSADSGAMSKMMMRVTRNKESS